MSDLNYYGQVPPPHLPHRTGLTVWGVLAIVVGGFVGLSGLGSTAMFGVVLAIKGKAGGGTFGMLVVNGVITAAMGGGLIWLGIGCCRGRRWVRPLLVAGGWLAVAVGGVSVVPVTLMMASAMTRAMSAGAASMPRGFVVGMEVGIGLMYVLLMVVLPVTLLAWFRRPSVAATLAATDPAASRWTDRVTLPALAWVMTCAWLGGSVAMVAGTGVWFWFTRTLVGWPAAGGAVVGLAIVVAGYGCYRRSAAAWAASVALFGLLAASGLTFAVAGDTGTYQRYMTERTQAMAGACTPTPAAGKGAVVQPNPFGTDFNPQLAPALMYAAAVVFGLIVRRWVVAVPGPSTGVTPAAVAG